MSRPPITPLDPDSPKGRETVARLTEVFARVRLAIAERKAAADAEQSGERAA